MTTSPAVSARDLEMRLISHRSCRLSPDLVDCVLFLPCIWLACSLGISLRLIGPLFVVIPVGLCLAYAVLRRTVPPRLLGTYVAFSIFMAILSKFQLLPTSWQTHFTEEAIVRQLVPMLGFFAVAWASKAYFRCRLVCGDVFFGAPFVLFLSLVVAPAVMFQQGLGYQGEEPAQAVVGLYGAFINNIVVAMFFITGAIFLTTDWRRYAGLAAVLVIAVVTNFVQFKVLIAVIIATLFGASGRLLVIGLVVAFTGIYAIGINYVPEIMIASPNSGIRLAFVADALSSAVETHGIGIGYGKSRSDGGISFPTCRISRFFPTRDQSRPPACWNCFRPVFTIPLFRLFCEPACWASFCSLLLFSRLFPSRFAKGRPKPRGNRIQHALHQLLREFGLETPIVVVGAGFVYGYLLALRASTHPQGVPRKSRSANH